jgi:hypothetical protein
MKLSLNEWVSEQKTEADVQDLQEKLIMFNNGKKYGQIVFLAGGAGSGKGFAISKFLDSSSYKVRDVDEWKVALLKLAEIKDKYKELRGLDLRNGKDVFKLHMFVKNMGIKERTLDLLLTDVSQDRLPNIIFDVTLKELGDISEVLPKLEEVGYDFKNIHLVWVLTNYSVAVKNNAGRARVVPDDIMLKTHVGAAKTMHQIVSGSIPRGVDGKVAVILNNRENTIPFLDKDGKPVKTKSGEIVVKDFTYVTIKKEGKPPVQRKEVQQQVFDWIKDNIPKTKETKELF